jgi:hypothetical protein
VGATTLGLVMNLTPAKQSGNSYGYGYGYGHSKTDTDPKRRSNAKASPDAPASFVITD